MTDTEQRFALSMRQADDDEPGLIRERDGTVWLVNPDGTRTQLPGEGSGVPDGGSTGEVLTKASNADGDADWEASGGSQTVTDGASSLVASTLQVPAGTLVNLGGGVAGIGLLFTVAGPLTVNFDDFDLDGSGDTPTLYTVPSDSIVLSAIARVRTPWDAAIAIAPDTEEIVINIGSSTVGAFDPDDGGTGVNLWRASGPKATGGTPVHAVGTTAECPLFASYSFNGDRPTQGIADIYVVVAIPAT